jgi:hypothetical protein
MQTPLPRVEFADILKDCESARALDQLLHEVDAWHDLVPFVGAGMSAPQFKTWGAFLGALAQKYPSSRINGINSTTHFADITQRLYDEIGEEEFLKLVAEEYGKDPVLEGTEPINRIRDLCTGPIVTTNFDTVIETVFRRAGEELPVRYGTSYFKELTERGRDRVLVKLHGDLSARESLIFARHQYRQGYGADGTVDYNKIVSSGLSDILKNKVVLCLGADLSSDETTTIFRAIRRHYPFAHFAIVPRLSADNQDPRQVARTRYLQDLGIVPIWLPAPDAKHPGREFKYIGPILDYLITELPGRRRPDSRPRALLISDQLRSSIVLYLENVRGLHSERTMSGFPPHFLDRMSSAGQAKIRRKLRLISDAYRTDQYEAARIERWRLTGFSGNDAYQPLRTLGLDEHIERLFFHEHGVYWDEITSDADFHQICVLSDPGFGKSWLLTEEASRLAAQILNADVDVAKQSHVMTEIPVIIELRRLYDRYIADATETLKPEIPKPNIPWLYRVLSETAISAHWPDRSITISIKMWLHARLLAGACTILLDGWDEISPNVIGVEERGKTLESFIDLLSAFSAQYPGRIVLASRYLGYTRSPLANAKELELMAFTTTDSEQFAKIWFDDRPDQKTRLIAAMKANYVFSSFARIPIMLNFICALDLYVDIPTRRTALYQQISSALMSRSGFRNVNLLMVGLSRLAAAAASNGQMTAAQVARELPLDSADANDNLLRGGLLTRLGNTDDSPFVFVHRSLLEYFLAVHWSNLGEISPSLSAATSLPASHVESIKFLAGLSPDSVTLVRQLVDRYKRTKSVTFLSTAAQCLTEVPDPYALGELLDFICTKTMRTWWDYCWTYGAEHKGLRAAVRAVAAVDGRVEGLPASQWVWGLPPWQFFDRDTSRLTLRVTGGTPLGDSIVRRCLDVLQLDSPQDQPLDISHFCRAIFGAGRLGRLVSMLAVLFERTFPTFERKDHAAASAANGIGLGARTVGRLRAGLVPRMFEDLVLPTVRALGEAQQLPDAVAAELMSRASNMPTATVGLAFLRTAHHIDRMSPSSDLFELLWLSCSATSISAEDRLEAAKLLGDCRLSPELLESLIQRQVERRAKLIEQIDGMRDEDIIIYGVAGLGILQFAFEAMDGTIAAPIDHLLCAFERAAGLGSHGDPTGSTIELLGKRILALPKFYVLVLGEALAFGARGKFRHDTGYLFSWLLDQLRYEQTWGEVSSALSLWSIIVGSSARGVAADDLRAILLSERRFMRSAILAICMKSPPALVREVLARKSGSSRDAAIGEIVDRCVGDRGEAELCFRVILRCGGEERRILKDIAAAAISGAVGSLARRKMILDTLVDIGDIGILNQLQSALLLVARDAEDDLAASAVRALGRTTQNPGVVRAVLARIDGFGIFLRGKRRRLRRAAKRALTELDVRGAELS